jgi:pSer/pThr/pTyr-binding forkhead associated (FHA) protein
MWLVLHVLEGEPLGPALHFPPGQYVFGRAPGCHVLFPWPSAVSRRHCILFVNDQGASVRDLRSRNGTVVNSRRITREQP